ncbi:hypothetical protein [Kingella potus]|uniref:hypothetical protein n=1 Tax=Kingella potus TaxID=265175 RepID=UPI001FD48846|nr:hypothetical protein [Kingella potus]UOP01244.1 hypothetical protein LVJ84_02945 [Kingella potus]
MAAERMRRRTTGRLKNSRPQKARQPASPNRFYTPPCRHAASAAAAACLFRQAV